MNSVLITLDKDVLLTPEEDTQYIVIPTHKKSIFELDFKKQGINCEIISLYRLKSGERVDFVTIAKHSVANTSCNTIVRGVLGDGCLSDYIGKIIIEKSAQQTTSYLDDKLLVIGSGIKHRSDPILEIEANDVKASHGSTTGTISELDLFYLMSRGLDRETAKKLVVEGFFAGIINTISDIKVRSEVSNLLDI